MLKKIIAIIICLSLVLPTAVVDVRAAEYDVQYLTVKRLNDGDQSIYKVVTDGKDVFIGTNDLVKLAKYDSRIIDMSEEKLNQVILTKKKDHHGFNQDITIDSKTNSVSSDLYGKKDFDGYLVLEDDIYLNLIDMLNYLRIKADVIGGKLYVNIPVYTMLDFMIEDYPSVLMNSVSQLDLLEAQGNRYTSAFLNALSLACNNFDFRLLVPGWGANALKDEQYTKAIQALNEDDEVFYTEDTKSYMKDVLEGKGFTGVLATGEDLINIMSFGGSALETAEDVIDQLEGVSEDTLDAFMDLLNWNGRTFDSAMQLRAWSKQAGKLSDALSIANIIVSAYEAYKRAESWNEDGINDLEVLKGLDVNNYGEHKEYVERIKKIANKCYESTIDPEGAVSEQAFSDTVSLIFEKSISEGSIYGKVADLFILAINTGVSVAKTFGNVADAMDKAELSYMVSCFINVAVAAQIDAEIQYTKLNLRDFNSGMVEDFRNSMRTALKSNLRCWSYIYYINRNGNWENSFRGKEVKAKIDKMNTYLTLLDEAEQYDYALDEYDLYPYSPERIINILSNDGEWTDERLYAEYKQIVERQEKEHGFLSLAESNNNFGEQYLSGVSYIDLIDFDNDGSEELLLYYSDGLDKYNMPVYKYQIYKYEKDAVSVQQVLEGTGCEDMNGAFFYVSLANYEGKTYLFVPMTEYNSGGYFARYYGDHKGTIELAKEFEIRDEYSPNASYYEDGNSITQEQFLNNPWRECSYQQYLLFPFPDRESGGQYTETTYAEVDQTLTKINEVREKLGLDLVDPAREGSP